MKKYWQNWSNIAQFIKDLKAKVKQSKRAFHLKLGCRSNGRTIFYICKAEILSVCLSVHLSVMLLTLLELSTSPYQLPNIKSPSSCSFKFVTASKCGDQLAFYSRLKTKKWRKLEQHSIENHSHMAQSVVQLTYIQEVAGSNPGGK